MDVVVSNMAWFQKSQLGPGRVATLKDLLVVVPKVFSGYTEDDTPTAPTRVVCYRETPELFGVPRAYFRDNAKESHLVTYQTSPGRPVSLQSSVRMTGRYIEQATAVDTLVSTLQSRDQCMLKARPGWGKTNVALEVYRRLGVTGVVLVHKEFLMKQWIRRAAKVLPGIKIGIVREKKCQFEGYDLVVAMMESLALEDGHRYPKEFYRWPGFVIVDEAHRAAAPSFSKAAPLFDARYRLAVTATPRRLDGAEDVFRWHLGQIAYDAKTEMPKPTVWVVKAPLLGMSAEVVEATGKAIVTTALSKLSLRNRRIVRVLLKLVQGPSERKVMVIGHRLEQLRDLKESFETCCRTAGLGVTTGVYTGEWWTGRFKKKTLASGVEVEVEVRAKLKEADLEAAESARVLFSTYQMVAEGLDIPALDTIIFATPSGDVEQSVGRTQRFCVATEEDGAPEKCARLCPWRAGKCLEKPMPLVVDLVDRGVRMSEVREGYRRDFYRSIGAKVIDPPKH